MSIPRTLRWLDDPPAAGAWNMAVDEALALGVGEEPCLRFYRWTPATLSLGFFQRFAERELHAASRACPVVRRASGGGAIVHDHELTYSLTVPVKHPLAVDPLALYRRLHTTLAEALREFSVFVELCPAELVPLGDKPFLCFQRRSAGDVLLAGHKVCGSAQRRHRDAVLQHGSVLLSTSPAAPELVGIEQVAGRRIEPAELCRNWSRRIAAELGLVLRPEELSTEERELASRLADEQFSTETWTARR